MNLVLETIYKISWMFKKMFGYKRPGTIKEINNSFEPTNNKIIAYSIACHKNAHQIIRLMKAIYHKDNLYYINLDLKTPLKFYKTIMNHFSAYENVYITNNSVDWGGWNQVQVVLDLMKNSLAVDKSWTHFINISGQDFPLKKQTEIMTELASQPGINYIGARYYPPDHEKSKKLFSLRRWGSRKKNQPRLDLLHPEIKFYKGSQWMILSRNFCDYVINNEASKKIKLLFKDAFIPDESFFPTLAANSDFTSTTYWDNKHYTDWSRNVSHPEILTMKHLPKMTTGDFYFARKFDETVDEEVITELEKRL